MLKREPSLNSIGSDGNTSFLRAARAGHLDKVLEHLKSNIDINTSNANGLNALHLASKDGHVDVVAELLRRGAVVDAATKKGNTALHIASLAGQEEVVKLLVQHGASVNVQSQNGFTPLYMAAQENHDNVVKYLLSNGANQSLATEDGFTPLAVAMQQGHDKVVTVLLENDTRGKVRLPALHIAAKKDDVKAAKLLLENEHNPDVTSKSGFTPLHIASHYGNEAIANLLIHKGADVNYAAKHNITPLHVAAKWGKTNMVALLLEHGANIESKTRDGLTPLHCAARSGHEQVVDMLLERGAPISCKTKNGLAPLHMAAQGDHVDAARILLYHRAPVDEVTVDYLTALHVAAHCGHVRVAKLLLDRQADANARALNGFTPLHIACKKNRIKVVELLLKHGASIGATTESGLTPLHVASFMGCMNIVIYLLQHDANPDVPTVRGETPLHLAARANQTDIIRILLRNGAQVDARAREQQTPLHIASRLGNVDIVMLLLQHGAKVDTTTKDMYTALHIAAKEGQDEVAAVLIENGASLNATTKKGFTPLHLAAKYGNIKVAKLLLQKEAPVDAQGKNGVTPLHVASHYDHQNVALLLLDKGASPHATAKNGHTPLHIAARKNQMDIANTLLEYGAKPNAESKAGFTPLHLSAQEGHTDMSSLLIEHEANTNHPAKNGLTPMHLCAQEDRVPVAEILAKNGAQIDAATKGGFTPLHIASHYGQTNMVKFLLANGANVGATTSLFYTPLHQAAQQGHTNIVNILLENSAQPNSVTMNGQTPLNIAQKLGYISVIETLKVVTETTTTTTTTTTIEEKYKVVAPEAMQETFMSDSEEEGGEDTVLGDHSYRYLTADEMKSLGDDSLPIDVTRDERIDSNKMVTSEEQNVLPPQAIEDNMSPQYITENYVEYTKKYTPDNVDIGRHPINIGFLVSFLVDARGGAMRGCRHSGVRVIVPPRCAPSPTRITCRYVRPQRTPHPPPLMEGEALASRVLELGPVGAKFLGPVIIEVPHFAALRGKEREIVILRSDNGETWREHTVEASEDILNEVLNDSFEAEDLSQLEDISSGRITRVVTHDFPQYFAIVTRIRQEVHAIGPEGGMVSSTVVPQVQAVFPQGALTKKIKVGLQAQPIDPELSAKLLGHGVAVSPVVTVEPRRRKFHKAITLSMPAPRAHSQGMINQYSGNAPTLRLLCSITGGTTRAQWEDVTGSTPLTFVNDCVSFTTTVSARFWLMDCRNIGDATKMATELYKEAIHVPFMAKFVVFAKRIDPLEARLRVFCMTDDKEDKTLEHQEHFTEVAKSRDVEVLEGKPQFIEFAGNLVPITKSGEPLQFSFRAFRENRLPFSVRVKDQHAEAVGRCLFMREPKVAKGEPPQQPICILNIVLPDDIVTETVTLADSDTLKRHVFLKDNFEYYRPDPRLADMSNLLGEDWVPLATQLGLTPSEINVIKSEYPDSVAKQAQSMLRMWISQSGNKAQGDALESALMRIGREDIIPQCLNVDDEDRIPRIPKETRYHKDIDTSLETLPPRQKETYESKYSAEEKEVEEVSDDEEDFLKSVSERRQQIEKRLTDRKIPASAQRQEIAEEITSIKRQSMVEDKIAEVEVKQKPEPIKTTTIIKTVTTDVPETKKTVAETVETTKTTTTTDYPPSEVTVTKQFMEEEKPDRKTTVRTIITETRTTEHIPTNEIPIPGTDRRDSDLLEGVTQRLETTKKRVMRTPTIDGDPNSPKLSKTPPPSPADFIFKEQAAVIQEWSAPDGQSKDKPAAAVAKQGAAMQGVPTSTTTKHLASSEELSLDSPKLSNDNDLSTLAQQTNAFIEIESRRESDSELRTVSRESRLPKQDDKTKTLSRDSSREDTSRGEEKKAKKGFFGTLKSFVGKSQDRSDSESEKSQKKEKRKEKRKDKKKKLKLPHEKPPLEPPERPPRKPKLPTPPPLPDERPGLEDIPYVESSLTELVNGVSDEHHDHVETTDLDAMNEIPEHVKTAANDLVSDIIATGETKALDILERSPTTKHVIVKEEIEKKIEPKIYDAGEFRVVVTPTKRSKPKDYFKADLNEKVTESTPTVQTPVRPQRRKEHIYEDIEEPTQQPPTKLILYAAEPIPDIKVLTTNLIQSEINFAGWSDDKSNVFKPSEIKEKGQTLPRTGKKHGGKLFGFLGKKSSKDVDESDSEKDSQREIIEKQDREPSKERMVKPDSLSDGEEGVDHKKGGFFGIFSKKSKKEDEHEKEVPEISETEIRTITTRIESSREKTPDKKVSEITETIPKVESATFVEKTDTSPERKPRKKPKKEKVQSESEDESEHRKGGLFGLFGKKGKKESKEEPPKAVQISETVMKDMNDSTQFLQNEITYFDDVKIISPKISEISSEKPDIIVKETVLKQKSEKVETEKLPEVTMKEQEKTSTKMKKKKYQQEKRESSVSEDESEGRKSGLFGLFGKKHKKDKSREKSPKIPDEVKPSVDVVKQMTDTNDFLRKEVELFDDVKPVNGYYANGSAVHEPLIVKEQVKLKDIKKQTSDDPIDKDTQIEHIVTRQVTQIDPFTTQETTSATEITRKIVTTHKIVEVPITEKTKVEDMSQLPIEEKTIMKETIIKSVDGKPIKQETKIFETVPIKRIDDQTVSNIAMTADFLQDEIGHFNDVKPIPKEPLIRKESVKSKEEKQRSLSRESTPEVSEKTDKTKVKKDKGDSEIEERSPKKGGFFGLFGKKPKKDDDRERKDGEEPLPKDITLSAETVQQMQNSTKFLIDEINNFEDVRPIIKPIEEKLEKIVLEKPVAKIETDKLVTSKKPEDIPEVEKRKEKKEQIGTQSQENLETEKKGFFDIFGKKGKKEEKIKTKDEPPKEIKLSEKVLEDMVNSNLFLTNEVMNFDDVKPVKTVVVEEKLEKIVLEKPLPSIGLQKLETAKYTEEVTVPTAKPADFLKEEVDHFDDVKTIKKGGSLKKDKKKEKTPPKPEDVKAEKTHTLDKKKPKKDKPEDEEPESQKKGGFFGLFGKKAKKEEKLPEKPIISEAVQKTMSDCGQFLQQEVTVFDDVRPIIPRQVETHVTKITVKSTEGKPEDLIDNEDVSKIKIAKTADFLKDEIKRFDDVKEISRKSPEKSILKPTHIIKETIIVRGDLPAEEIRKILDDSEQVKEEIIVKEQVTKDEEKISKPTADQPVQDEDEQKKGGFFGLFTKKPKKDSEETDKLNEELKRTQTDDFLKTEVKKFQDVKEILPQLPERADLKAKPSKAKTLASEIEEVKVQKAQTDDFLQEEITRFHDVKQILPEIKEDIIVKEQVKLDDKKTSKQPKIADEEPEEKKKSGFFGIFSKKSKKDEDIVDENAAEEAKIAIENSDKFLQTEVERFEDVRPIIRKEIPESPVIKTNAKTSRTTPGKFAEIDEEAIVKRAQTVNFLQEEIDRFDDVKQILPKSPEKPALKPTHIIKETIIVRGDLPDEDIQKILDDSDQVKEDVIVKEEVTLKEKKKQKQEPKTIAEEPEEKKKSGFFGLFGKKSKKGEDDADEKAAEDAKIAIENSDKFLQTEVERFEDVRPIIKKEIPESLVIKTDAKTSRTKPVKSAEIDEEAIVKKAQTVNFLQEEIDRFDDVKQILPKSPEKPALKPTHIIKETIIVQGDLPDEDIQKILDDSDQVKEDVIVKEEVKVKEKKKPKPEPKTIAEEPEEKKRSGFFGLFGKKSKKGEDDADEKAAEETKIAIENSDKFLQTEVERFEDVRPIIKKEIPESPVIKIDAKASKTEPGKPTEIDEETIVKRALTVNFLQEEIDRFDDVKQILPKSSEKPALKPTHIIKETIIVRGDLPDEDIQKILDASDQVKEDLIVKEIKSEEKDILKQQLKTTVEEPEEKKKSGFFGLFGKKSKKDEDYFDEKATEELKLAMENSDQFLKTEVINFEDVRPIIKKDISESSSLKIDAKVSKAKPSKSTEPDSEAVVKRVQTENFLQEEINRFNDVNQMSPKPSEKPSLKPTHLIKETIILRGDVPDEDIKRILDESDQLKEDIVKEQVKTEEKEPKQETKPIEESEEKKRIGFFGLFGKKSKKDDQPDDKSAEEARIAIEHSNQFLETEVSNFEDVKPIIKKDIAATVSAVSDTTVPKTTLQKPVQPDEEAVNRAQTTSFLQEEINRFNDVKQILPKSPEKPSLTHILKETLIIQSDPPVEDITKVLDQKDQVKEDVIIKEEVKLKEKKKSKQEPNAVGEPKEKKKFGFFGLFDKKSKKDEDQLDDKSIQEAKIAIENSNEFLKTEINNFEDVRPIIKKEISEAPPVKIDAKVSKTNQIKEELLIHQQVKPEDKRKVKEDLKIIEEPEDKNKSGFFGLFEKMSKKDEKLSDEDEAENARLAIENCQQFLGNEVTHFEDVKPIIQQQVTERPLAKAAVKVSESKPEEDIKLKGAQTTDFLIEEIKRFDDVKQILPDSPDKPLTKPTHIIKERFVIRGDLSEEEVRKLLDDADQIKEDITIRQVELNGSAKVEKLKKTASEEYMENVAKTTDFLADEIKYFEDVRPAVKESSPEKVVQMSPKKDKKKKKGKRESSESGDESDGSKKSSGIFKLFGKKGKKDKSEGKAEKTKEDAISDDAAKSKSLERAAIIPEEKAKPERKSSQKKHKKEKSQEDAKPLFGIFGKKDKLPSEIPTEPNMTDSADFLKTEVRKFDDLKESKEKIMKSDVNLDGKMTIAEITKTLEPKTYETGEFQIVVSPTGESKRKEFSVSLGEKIEKMEKQIVPTTEQVTVATSAEVPITYQKLTIETTLPASKEEPKHVDHKSISKVQVIKIAERATPEVELSQEVLKNMIDTSNFLNQEITRFHDVRPLLREREKTPPSDLEDSKDKKKRKKKQRQKSIDDETSRKSGFFGLFGKKEKKPESSEVASEIRVSEEQKDKVVDKKSVESKTIETTKEEKAPKDDTCPIDFVESVHMTNNFLNDEIKNYHDVKIVPKNIETAVTTTATAIDSQQKELEPKTKSKSLFGLFGKKSEDQTDEQQPKKDITMKEKRERRKSGSPFRLFTKKSKEEEKTEDPTPTVSEQTLQDMYETKNFLSTEVMRYSDAPYVPGEKQPAEIKKSVAFVEDSIAKISDIQPIAVASTTTIVKEIADDRKVKVETVLKEIKDDLQPAEKVIVVIKDDVSDKAKSIKEMKFSPPDIISEITASIPADSTIKEIHVETLEEDIERLKSITPEQMEELTKDTQLKETKPPSTSHGMQGFLMSERVSADIDLEPDSKTKPIKEISKEFDQITGDVLELTKELDATAELLHTKASSKEDDLKKESKKAARKSVGFFGKLGEKIGGKAKQSKDIIESTELDTSKIVEEAAQKHIEETEDTAKDIHEKIIQDLKELEDETSKSIDQLEKEMQHLKEEKVQDISKGIEDPKTAVGTTSKVTTIGDIVQTEIDKITLELEDPSKKSVELAYEISSTTEKSVKKDAEDKIGQKTKSDPKKVAKKSGGFLGKLGDKLSNKGKEEIEQTEDKIDDKLKHVEIGISRFGAKVEEVKHTTESTVSAEADKASTGISQIDTQMQVAAQDTKQGVGHTTEDIKTDIEKKIDDLREDLTKTLDITFTTQEPTGYLMQDTFKVYDPEAVKKQTRTFVDEMKMSGQEPIAETKTGSEKDVLETSKQSVTMQEEQPIKIKKGKKPRKKSGGFFSKLGGIFTDKGEELGKVSQETEDQMRQAKDSVEKTTEELAKETNALLTDLRDKATETVTITSDKMKEGESKAATVAITALDSAKEQTESAKKISQDATKDGKTKIGGFFGSLGRKAKDTKSKISAEITESQAVAADKAKDAKQSLEVTTADAAKQAGQTVQSGIDITTRKGAELSDKTGEVVTDVSQGIKDISKQTADSAQKASTDIKESTESASKELKQDLKEGTSKIGRFIVGVGRTTTDVEDDVSQMLTDAGRTLDSKAKQTVASTEKVGLDLTAQSTQAFIDIEGHTKEVEQAAADAIERKGQSIKVEAATEITQDRAESAKQTTQTETADVKDIFIDGVSAIGGFFSSFGEQAEKAKDGISEKRKETGIIVADTTKHATEATGQAVPDLAKKTSEDLITIKDQVTATTGIAIDKIKEEGKVVTDKGGQASIAVSGIVQDKTDSAKHTIGEIAKDVKDDVSESTGKVGGFFGDFGKKAQEVKDESREKIKEFSGTISDTKQAASDLVNETGDGLTTIEDQIGDVSDTIIDETKEQGKIVVQTGDQQFTAISEAVEDKTDSAKHSVQDMSKDVKTTISEGAGKVGGFFSGFGKRSKKVKDKTSQKIKEAGTVVADATKAAAEVTEQTASNLAQKTGDGLITIKDQVIDATDTALDKTKKGAEVVTKKGDQAFTAASEKIQEKTESTKQKVGEVSKDVKDTLAEGATKVGGFFSGVGKKTKKAKDKTSDTVTEVGAVADTTKAAGDIAGQAASDLAKKTGDGLVTIKDQVTDTTSSAIDKIEAEGEAVVQIGDQTSKAVSETVQEKTESGKQIAKDVSKDVRDTVSESASKIGGFFGGFGKKAKKVKDEASEKIKDTGTTAVDITKQTAQSIDKTTNDITKQTGDFLSEMRKEAEDETRSAVDGIKESEKVVIEKGDQVLTAISETIQDKAESATRGIGDVSKDVKGNIVEGVSHIEGFVGDLDKKTQETKDATSDKIKEVGITVDDAAKEGAESVSKAADDTVKQTSDFLTEKKKQTIDEVKTAADKGDQALEVVYDMAQEKAETAKQTTEDVSKDVKDSVGGFFDGVGKKAKKAKDETSEKVKEVAAAVVDKTKQAAEATSQAASDVSAKTGEGLVTVKDQVATTAGTGIDKIKAGGEAVVEKGDQTFTGISETVHDKSESTMQAVKDVSKDVKDIAADSTSKVGGFFSGFGKKAKKSKDKTSEKVKEVGVTVGDTVKEGAKSVSKAADDPVKQTSDFLTEMKKQTVDEVKTAADKGDQALEAVYDMAQEKAETAKQTTGDVSKDVKDSVGGFFDGVGKKAKKTKDETSEKVKEVTIAVVDKTKQAAEATSQAASDLSTKAGEGLVTVKDQVATTAGTAIDKIKAGGEAVVEKGEQTFTGVSETVHDKSESTMQAVKDVSKDVKDVATDSASKVGGFFSGFGKKAKKSKDKTSDKVKEVGVTVGDTVKEGAESVSKAADDMAKQTSDFLSELKKQTTDEAETAVKKADQTFGIVSGEVQEKESTKRATQDVSKEVKNRVAEDTNQIGGFFDDLGKTIKKTKDETSEKLKEATTAVVDKTKQATETTSQAASDLSKKTGDGLVIIKDRAVHVTGTAIDKTKEGVTVVATKGDQAFTAASEVVQDKTHSAKQAVGEAGKGVKASMKDAGESITGLFSGFSKKKDKKKDKQATSGAPKVAEGSSGHLSDVDRFLFEERGRLLQESSDGATGDKILRDASSKSPVVTSPTLPRRVASHRIARGDVPYFVEVTNLSYDDSSSDDSYIVTEPTEKYSARISDESSSDSGRKRKPLFHIESQDSFDASHRGSIKSDILENVSAHRLETLITDLDEVDDAVPSGTLFTSSALFEASKDAKTASQLETDIIERKLSDIEKALGSLEQAETVETQKEKPSLKRVERKFERMASEVMADGATKDKDIKLTTPEMEERQEQDFRKIVSQLSTEEMSECQREYAALWDEQTFSPSDGCDTSKTPDSQAEVLDLPQGDIIYMGPVTLNKDHLINKAGVEVDVIPIMKSPCPSPRPQKKRSTKRAKSELGFHSKLDRSIDRGSLPDLHTYKKGAIMDTILRMSPNVFLSRSACTESNESVSSYLRSDDRMAKSLGSNDSLSKGLITSAVVNWLQKSSPFGSVDNMTQSVSSNQTSTCDFTDLTEASGPSRHENQVPDIFISEDEVLVVPRYSPKPARKSRRRNKKSKREKCSLDQTPLGEASGTVQRPDTQTASQSFTKAETEESSGRRQPSSERERPIADQHMLSDEMKKLLKELEEESKK